MASAVDRAVKTRNSQSPPDDTPVKSWSVESSGQCTSSVVPDFSAFGGWSTAGLDTSGLLERVCDDVMERTPALRATLDKRSDGLFSKIVAPDSLRSLLGDVCMLADHELEQRGMWPSAVVKADDAYRAYHAHAGVKKHSLLSKQSMATLIEESLADHAVREARLAAAVAVRDMEKLFKHNQKKGMDGERAVVTRWKARHGGAFQSRLEKMAEECPATAPAVQWKSAWDRADAAAIAAGKEAVVIAHEVCRARGLSVAFEADDLVMGANVGIATGLMRCFTAKSREANARTRFYATMVAERLLAGVLSYMKIEKSVDGLKTALEATADSEPTRLIYYRALCHLRLAGIGDSGVLSSGASWFEAFVSNKTALSSYDGDKVQWARVHKAVLELGDAWCIARSLKNGKKEAAYVATALVGLLAWESIAMLAANVDLSKCRHAGDPSSLPSQHCTVAHVADLQQLRISEDDCPKTSKHDSRRTVEMARSVMASPELKRDLSSDDIRDGCICYALSAMTDVLKTVSLEEYCALDGECICPLLIADEMEETVNGMSATVIMNLFPSTDILHGEYYELYRWRTRFLRVSDHVAAVMGFALERRLHWVGHRDVIAMCSASQGDCKSMFAPGKRLPWHDDLVACVRRGVNMYQVACAMSNPLALLTVACRSRQVARGDDSEVGPEAVSVQESLERSFVRGRGADGWCTRSSEWSVRTGLRRLCHCAHELFVASPRPPNEEWDKWDMGTTWDTVFSYAAKDVHERNKWLVCSVFRTGLLLRAADRGAREARVLVMHDVLMSSAAARPACWPVKRGKTSFVAESQRRLKGDALVSERALVTERLLAAMLDVAVRPAPWSESAWKSRTWWKVGVLSKLWTKSKGEHDHGLTISPASKLFDDEAAKAAVQGYVTNFCGRRIEHDFRDQGCSPSEENALWRAAFRDALDSLVAVAVDESVASECVATVDVCVFLRRVVSRVSERAADECDVALIHKLDRVMSFFGSTGDTRAQHDLMDMLVSEAAESQGQAPMLGCMWTLRALTTPVAPRVSDRIARVTASVLAFRLSSYVDAIPRSQFTDELAQGGLAVAWCVSTGFLRLAAGHYCPAALKLALKLENEAKRAKRELELLPRGTPSDGASLSPTVAKAVARSVLAAHLKRDDFPVREYQEHVADLCQETRDEARTMFCRSLWPLGVMNTSRTAVALRQLTAMALEDMVASPEDDDMQPTARKLFKWHSEAAAAAAAAEAAVEGGTPVCTVDPKTAWSMLRLYLRIVDVKATIRSLTRAVASMDGKGRLAHANIDDCPGIVSVLRRCPVPGACDPTRGLTDTPDRDLPFMLVATLMSSGWAGAAPFVAKVVRHVVHKEGGAWSTTTGESEHDVAALVGLLNVLVAHAPCSDGACQIEEYRRVLGSHAPRGSALEAQTKGLVLHCSCLAAAAAGGQDDAIVVLVLLRGLAVLACVSGWNDHGDYVYRRLVGFDAESVKKAPTDDWRHALVCCAPFERFASPSYRSWSLDQWGRFALASAQCCACMGRPEVLDVLVSLTLVWGAGPETAWDRPCDEATFTVLWLQYTGFRLDGPTSFPRHWLGARWSTHPDPRVAVCQLALRHERESPCVAPGTGPSAHVHSVVLRSFSLIMDVTVAGMCSEHTRSISGNVAGALLRWLGDTRRLAPDDSSTAAACYSLSDGSYANITSHQRSADGCMGSFVSRGCFLDQRVPDMREQWLEVLDSVGSGCASTVKELAKLGGRYPHGYCEQLLTIYQVHALHEGADLPADEWRPELLQCQQVLWKQEWDETVDVDAVAARHVSRQPSHGEARAGAPMAWKKALAFLCEAHKAGHPLAKLELASLKLRGTRPECALNLCHAEELLLETWRMVQGSPLFCRLVQMEQELLRRVAERVHKLKEERLSSWSGDSNFYDGGKGGKEKRSVSPRTRAKRLERRRKGRNVGQAEAGAVDAAGAADAADAAGQEEVHAGCCAAARERAAREEEAERQRAEDEREEKKRRELAELAEREQQGQRCPRCQTAWKRATQSNIVRCEHCGGRFCFLCAAVVDKKGFTRQHGYRDHFGQGSLCPRFGERRAPRSTADLPVVPSVAQLSSVRGGALADALAAGGGEGALDGTASEADSTAAMSVATEDVDVSDTSEHARCRIHSRCVLERHLQQAVKTEGTPTEDAEGRLSFLHVSPGGTKVVVSPSGKLVTAMYRRGSECERASRMETVSEEGDDVERAGSSA
jgi:ribosomal protein L37AE/L43A